MNLAADCLLAVVGLLPDAVTPRERDAAATLPSTFGARGRAWWTAAPRPYKGVKAPDLDKLYDKVAAPPQHFEVAEWLKAAGDDADLVVDLHLALTAAREYLVTAWPRLVIETFGGPRLMPMAVDDEAEIASLWAVLDEPTRVLDELDSGTLSPSQALAFRTVYPALYDHLRTAMAEGAAALSKADPEWMPDESQEIACSILTGQPPGLMTKAESAPAPAAAPKPDKDLGAGAAATQADRSSKPRSAQK